MLTSFIIQLGSASCHKHGGIFQDRDFDGSISFRFSGKLTPARTLLVHWISDTSKLALARNTEKETDGRSIAIWCQITRAKGKVKAGKQDFRLVRTSSVRFETEIFQLLVTNFAQASRPPLLNREIDRGSARRGNCWNTVSKCSVETVIKFERCGVIVAKWRISSMLFMLRVGKKGRKRSFRSREFYLYRVCFYPVSIISFLILKKILRCQLFLLWIK